MLQEDPSELVNCRIQLPKITKNMNIMEELASLLYIAVYDKDRGECRYFSILDRLATAVSKYGAKVALFELKRGSLAGPSTKPTLSKEAIESLSTIEACLEDREYELLALETLKNIALKALSKCFKGKESM